MINPITFKTSVAYNKKIEQNLEEDSPNPLRLKVSLSNLAAVSNYNQVLLKPQFDQDSIEILNKIEELKKLIPQKLELPYSFATNEINGERFYNNDGSLYLIKEYENNSILEYYPDKTGEKIKTIIEKDKDSGKILSKIKTSDKNNERINIIIFDENFNNKYTMFQIESGGNISSITEIYGNGKNFQSLFINPQNQVPERYLETRENPDGDFEIIDCKMKSGDIEEIIKTTPSKEVTIKYKDNQKIIDVKRKIPEG